VLEGQKGARRSSFLGRLSETCLYAARRVPEISDHIEDVDRAMRWDLAGNWGRSKSWMRSAVKAFAAQVQKGGRMLPPVIEECWQAAAQAFTNRKKVRQWSSISSPAEPRK